MSSVVNAPVVAEVPARPFVPGPAGAFAARELSVRGRTLFSTMHRWKNVARKR